MDLHILIFENKCERPLLCREKEELYKRLHSRRRQVSVRLAKEENRQVIGLVSCRNDANQRTVLISPPLRSHSSP